MHKLAKTSVPILPEIAARWSSRAFDPLRHVEPKKLTALFEAARWAPSCWGDEPWRYIVCDRGQDPKAWQRAFDVLDLGNQAWCKDVPVLLVVLADTLFTRNDQPNRWGAYDTGAASENLCLEAVHQGLIAHPMGGFDAQAVREAFQVPGRYQPMAMIAIGYPGRAEQLEGSRYEDEIAPRSRRPLSETFFAGCFGQPWKAR
ncbi:MAG: nitroreductase family protein [Halothiobacillaceae bacterium]